MEGRFDTELETPPVGRGRAGPAHKKSSGPWCSKDTKLTAILTVITFGVLAFVALEIAIVSKREDLDRTARATVAMHNETTDMRNNVEKYLRTITEQFPANQGPLTVEQVVDTIEKVHDIMLWVNDLKAGLPTEVHLVLCVFDRSKLSIVSHPSPDRPTVGEERQHAGGQREQRGGHGDQHV